MFAKSTVVYINTISSLLNKTILGNVSKNSIYGSYNTETHNQLARRKY